MTTSGHCVARACLNALFQFNARRQLSQLPTQAEPQAPSSAPSPQRPVNATRPGLRKKKMVPGQAAQPRLASNATRGPGRDRAAHDRRG